MPSPLLWRALIIAYLVQVLRDYPCLNLRWGYLALLLRHIPPEPSYDISEAPRSLPTPQLSRHSELLPFLLQLLFEMQHYLINSPRAICGIDDSAITQTNSLGILWSKELNTESIQTELKSVSVSVLQK